MPTYVLWDNYSEREVGSSKVLDEAKRVARSIARSRGVSNLKFKREVTVSGDVSYHSNDDAFTIIEVKSGRSYGGYSYGGYSYGGYAAGQKKYKRMVASCSCQAKVVRKKRKP